MSKQPSAEQLLHDLESLVEAGIQTNSPQLKKDMVSQFSDPKYWIREYVANSFDAGARTCNVSGREDDATVTIAVVDDGHGMNRAGVLDWAHLFRSVKTHHKDLPPVGTFGVGKLSPAAVPGQCSFLMVTSTGEECWRLRTGSLLDDSPLRLERVSPVPAQGTRFEITFAKEEM